jgi:hypothetical protein
VPTLKCRDVHKNIFELGTLYTVENINAIKLLGIETYACIFAYL